MKKKPISYVATDNQDCLNCPGCGRRIKPVPGPLIYRIIDAIMVGIISAGLVFVAVYTINKVLNAGADKAGTAATKSLK